MIRAIRQGIVFLVLSVPSVGAAGSFSVGYEFGEMILNEFKHFAGELSYSFENEHALRMAVFNVALSERHLSSNEASAVEGDNVEGLWHGVDLYYDYPLTENIFVSPSIGYHRNKYTHTVLGTSVSNSTGTAGFALSYLGEDVLGIEKLHWRFSLTFNHSFNEQEEEVLGESIVQGESFAFVPLIFVGYEFK